MNIKTVKTNIDHLPLYNRVDFGKSCSSTDEKISSTCPCSINQLTPKARTTLAHRIVLWVKIAACWLETALKILLGCLIKKSVPNPLLKKTSLATHSSRDIVYKKKNFLPLKTPQIAFKVGDNDAFPLRSPFYSSQNPSEEAISQFKLALNEILLLAKEKGSLEIKLAGRPYITLKLKTDEKLLGAKTSATSEEAEARKTLPKAKSNQKPLGFRTPGAIPAAIEQNLFSILSPFNFEARTHARTPIPVWNQLSLDNQSKNAVSPYHQRQEKAPLAAHSAEDIIYKKGFLAFFKTPQIAFRVGNDYAFLLKNPFCSLQKPSDEAVGQFNFSLKKILHLAKEKGSLEIKLAGGPGIVLKLKTDEKLLGAETSVTSEEAEARKILLKTKSNQEPLIITLQGLAANQFAEPIEKSSADPSLFPALDSSDSALVSGRNRLLNYIEELVPVWDQHPLNLGQAIQYCVKLSKSGTKLSPLQKEKIRFFFDKLKANHGKVDIPLYLANRIELQRILSPRLNKLMKKKDPSRSDLLEIDLAKAELSTSFGYGIVPTANGKNGAVFIKTFEDRAVGVFKSPQQPGFLDLIELTKKYFGQARLLNNEKMAQEYAEIAASDLCRHLCLSDMAPDAIMAEFAGEKGAFITFLDGYCELKSVNDVFNNRKDFKEEELIKWQTMTIWNFLIGNQDPHSENIFVKLSASKEIEQIKMIDHGNSFPVSNPGWLGSKGNLGAWGHYPISKEPFLPQIRELIEKNITEESLQEFFDADKERSHFFTPEMRNLQLQRARILKECVAKELILTPKDLAKIKTDQNHEKYLKI